MIKKDTNKKGKDKKGKWLFLKNILLIFAVIMTLLVLASMIIRSAGLRIDYSPVTIDGVEKKWSWSNISLKPNVAQPINDSSGNLQFITTQIETFQLYMVLFTLMAGLIGFIGYQTISDAMGRKVADNLDERFEKIKDDAEALSKEILADSSKKKINQWIEEAMPDLELKIRDVIKKAENEKSLKGQYAETLPTPADDSEKT